MLNPFFQSLNEFRLMVIFCDVVAGLPLQAADAPWNKEKRR